MTFESKQISERIERPLGEVYAYASDPAHLPEWASGLGTGVTEEGGTWWVETGSGRLGLEFAPHNDYGVLDHNVILPTGEVVYNPLRVVANAEGSEIVFTLRRTPDMTDEDFDRDAALVQADLTRLKQLLESA
ncbi:MAG TPA: hypothetical protein VL551_28535 [Actinospica sp.]|jgi:hypothetical protein|nr:hypothetical protein [Actinospica sp.]